jgi:hypothetical protein
MILGEPVSLPFDDFPMQTRPFYHGRPCFLPACLALNKLRDRLDDGRITV